MTTAALQNPTENSWGYARWSSIGLVVRISVIDVKVQSVVDLLARMWKPTIVGPTEELDRKND